jgi:hypothetical protein
MSQTNHAVDPRDTIAMAPHSFEGVWALVPIVATLGGILAYAVPTSDSRAPLVIGLALVVGGWQQLWTVLTRTDWYTPLQAWHWWERSDPLPPWPYLQPGTPGAALHGALSRARAWWRSVGRAALTPSLTRAVVAAVISLLLGLALGRVALLLSFSFAACAQLATLWADGRGQAGPIWSALALAGFPWFLGGVLTGSDTLSLLVSSLALTALIGLYTQRSAWAVLGPLLGGAFLIAQGAASAAGWLLILALPGLIILTTRPSRDRYRVMVAPYVLGMIVLLAAVL